MDLEHELRARFDTLADGIRESAVRHFGDAAQDLLATIERERAEAAADAARAAREAAEREADERLAARLADADVRAVEAEALGRETGRLQGRDEGIRDGLAQGRHEGRESALAEAETAGLAATKRLTEAIEAIDRARSLSDILDTLAIRAGQEASRVALLLIDGDRLRGWRFIGFEPAVDDPSAFEMRTAEAGIIADAVRSGDVVLADSATENLGPSFAPVPAGFDLFALPMSIGGHAVAVLYADQFGADQFRADQRGTGGSVAPARASWPAAVEILARHAARSLELVTAFRAVQVLTDRPRRSSSLVEARR